MAREILGYIKMLVWVFIIVFIVDGVIFVNATIPSGSMENTVMTGDRLFGIRNAYGPNLELFSKNILKVKMKDPERMDIIIFHYPDDESQLFIKRIIGLPGETVEVKGGDVYINGKVEEQCNAHIKEPMQGNFGPYQVPEGSYFVMGDNRNNSNDSRFWKQPFVKYEQIVGKAFLRYWPAIKLF